MISKILNELERLQKENEELKRQVNMLDEAYSNSIKESKKWFDITYDSIPKQVIRDKIEELNKDIIKMKKAKDRNEYITIKEIVWDKTISILKELLGE